MHTTTENSPKNETVIILRALRPGSRILKDYGRAVPMADWSDVMDEVGTRLDYCDDQFLEVLSAMAKRGLIMFDEDVGLVSLPEPARDDDEG
jgi:hypothetical protein